MTPREQRNAKAIGTLHPEFIPLVESFIDRITLMGAHPLIVQSRRTFAEQDALYAQGRTASGAIVTNARAGSSFHNYGCAIDWVDVAASGDLDKYEPTDFDKTDYEKWIVLRPSGVRWGGVWKHPDRPHLEWSPGFTEHDASKLAVFADDNGFLPPRFFADRAGSA